MAADQGWYPGWFESAYFPSVWFAPGDESAVPPEELQQVEAVGAAPVDKDRPRRKARRTTPQWLAQMPVEEEDALLLIGAL